MHSVLIATSDKSSKIMKIVCNICKKFKVELTSDKIAEIFCDHVVKCPSKSGSEYDDRFCCSICETVLTRKRGFRQHLQKHIKSSNNTETNKEVAANISKERRREEFHAARNFVDVDAARNFVDVDPAVVEDDPNYCGYQEDQRQQEDVAEDFNFSKFEKSALLIATELFGTMNISMDMAEHFMSYIEKMMSLSNMLIYKKAEQILNTLNDENKQVILDSINSTTELITLTHSKMNTEQKLKTTLKRKKLLEEPKTRIYDEFQDQVGDDLVTVKCEASIFPMAFQIKGFLSKPGILQSILDNQKKIEESDPDLIVNFMSGSYWKQLKAVFGDKTVIPVFLYNDDFGPDDGLSPHSSSNKISGFYYGFPTLPQEIASQIDSIFIAMLAKAQDTQTHGPNKLLKILVSELKPLEEDGIKIGDNHIFIAPCLLLGDNLGVNMNLGLPTGFLAHYHCKTCYMHRDSMQIACSEDEDVLRTVEHYESCIRALERGDQAYGLKFRTNLNDLKSFNFSKSLVADIMHDLMTGVFVYGVIQLIKKATAEHKFTLKRFNEEKNGFDYGDKEKNYIMENITQDHLKNGKIKCHARECWNLIKYLPAILSKLLPQNCPLRKYGSILCDLLELCLKNSFNSDDLIILEATIKQHNEQFLRLFNGVGDRPLPPKGHYLLHYCRIIKNSGPLKYLSSMRYEAKHQQLKAYAKICHSRRNLCYSLSKKMCFRFAYELLLNEDKFKKVTDVSVMNSSFNMRSTAIEGLTNSRKLKFKGKVYAVGDFILSFCLKYAYKVLEIAVDDFNDKVVLVTARYEIAYNSAIKMYKLIPNETGTVEECQQIEAFAFPPIRAHRFECNNYLHYEEF